MPRVARPAILAVTSADVAATSVGAADPGRPDDGGTATSTTHGNQHGSEEENQRGQHKQGEDSAPSRGGNHGRSPSGDDRAEGSKASPRSSVAPNSVSKPQSAAPAAN